MFGFLSGLLLYSLLFYGGVRPSDVFILGIAAVLGFALLVVSDAIRGRPLSVPFLVFQILCLFVMISVGVKPALGLFAAGWSWEAARRSEHSLLRFLYFLFIVGLLEALLGLFQYFVEPGWMPGYINAFNTSSGTLINRNHFAGLLEMIVPVSIGLAYMAARRHQEMARPYVFLLGGAFMGLAVVFSLSRTGIFSLLMTLLFLTVVVRVHASQRRLGALLGITFLGLLAAGALWIGIDVVLERYQEALKQDAVLREGRMIVFRDTLRMIAANPKGIGIGKYQDIFRQYQTFHPDLLFDHAHNDYLESIAEWGILISSVFWILVFGIFFQTVRTFLQIQEPEHRGVMLACIGAMFAILLHSMTDFNLQIPSNAMLFFSFAGIALHFATKTLEIRRE